MSEENTDTKRFDWMCENAVIPFLEDGKWQVAYCPMRDFNTPRQAIDAAMFEFEQNIVNQNES